MIDTNFTLKYNMAYQLVEEDGTIPLHSTLDERFLNPLPLIISFSNLGIDKGYTVDYDFLRSINGGALNVIKILYLETFSILYEYTN